MLSPASYVCLHNLPSCLCVCPYALHLLLVLRRRKTCVCFSVLPSFSSCLPGYVFSVLLPTRHSLPLLSVLHVACVVIYVAGRLRFLLLWAFWRLFCPLRAGSGTRHGRGSSAWSWQAAAGTLSFTFCGSIFWFVLSILLDLSTYYENVVCIQ